MPRKKADCIRKTTERFPGFCPRKLADKATRQPSISAEESNKDEVLEAFRTVGHGGNLAYADERFRDDEEVVRAAIQSTPSAFWHASERLRGCKALVLDAVDADPDNLFWADDELKDDEDVVDRAVKLDALARRFASPRLSSWSLERHRLFPPVDGQQRAFDLACIGWRMRLGVKERPGVLYELWVNVIMPLAMEPLGVWFRARDGDLSEALRKYRSYRLMNTEANKNAGRCLCEHRCFWDLGCERFGGGRNHNIVFGCVGRHKTFAQLFMGA